MTITFPYAIQKQDSTTEGKWVHFKNVETNHRSEVHTALAPHIDVLGANPHSSFRLVDLRNGRLVAESLVFWGYIRPLNPLLSDADWNHAIKPTRLLSKALDEAEDLLDQYRDSQIKITYGGPLGPVVAIVPTPL